MILTIVLAPCTPAVLSETVNIYSYSTYYSLRCFCTFPLTETCIKLGHCSVGGRWVAPIAAHFSLTFASLLVLSHYRLVYDNKNCRFAPKSLRVFRAWQEMCRMTDKDQCYWWQRSVPNVLLVLVLAYCQLETMLTVWRVGSAHQLWSQQNQL